MTKRKFEKGDKYRPVVHIEKVKNGTPTVLKVSGIVTCWSIKTNLKKEWRDETPN